MGKCPVLYVFHFGVFPKIMLPQNGYGKPYEQMDDLGGFPPIFGNTQNSFLLHGYEKKKPLKLHQVFDL